VRIHSAAWFPPNLTISADANLVELVAVVRDGQDRPIGGLKVADFEVLDNKLPQPITVFAELRSGVAVPSAGVDTLGGDKSTPSASPADRRTIALFFDDAHAELEGLHKSAEAAAKLITENLHPEDRVGIFTASGVESVDFTSDRDALLAALARLYPRPLSGTTAITECPRLDAWEAYAIVKHVDPALELAKLNEAAACSCTGATDIMCRNAQRPSLLTKAAMVWSFSQFRSSTTLDAIGIVIRHLAAQPVKRILILMTPAFPADKDMESRTSALIDAALRANIRMSTLKLKGKVPFDLARQEFLGQSAKATGGQFVDGYADPTRSLREAVLEPKVSYVLGFSPAGEPDGANHSLRTRVVGNRAYRVEARTAYFAAKPAGETAQERIDRFAMSNEEVHDFPAAISLRQENGQLRVKISVDAKALQFPPKEGRQVEELTLLTELEDAQGNFVAGKESVMDLALTAATLKEKLREGIQAETALNAPRPGMYRVREVIREAAQNHVWAGSVTVEIH
jgi:VWFA-related protein